MLQNYLHIWLWILLSNYAILCIGKVDCSKIMSVHKVTLKKFCVDEGRKTTDQKTDKTKSATNLGKSRTDKTIFDRLFECSLQRPNYPYERTFFCATRQSART